MKSVYSAVRTGSLNKAVRASSFRTNSDLYHLQHKLIGFYNRDEKCLLRGTDWVFTPLNAELSPICHLLALLGSHHILHVSRIKVKYSSLRFVCKGLNKGRTAHIV